MTDFYRTFRNINQLNSELEDGVPWELVAVEWFDAEAEVDRGTRIYRNPILLMKCVRN